MFSMNSKAPVFPEAYSPQGVKTPGLRRERTAAGYTVSSLARAAEVSKGHISGIERGHHGASLDCLRKVAAVLGCKIGDLTTESPAPDPGDATDDERRAAA